MHIQIEMGFSTWYAGLSGAELDQLLDLLGRFVKMEGYPSYLTSEHLSVTPAILGRAPPLKSAVYSAPEPAPVPTNADDNIPF